MKRHKRGFTLIELLMVMMVIAIVSSMLFPALAMVMEVARRTSDGKSLNLLAQACRYYAEDNGEFLPVGRRNKPGFDDLDWVNYTSFWRTLQSTYSIKQDQRGCQDLIQEGMPYRDIYGTPDADYPDDTKLGWIYWGGRDDIYSLTAEGSRQIEYISPKKMNAPYNPSSETLFTCLCYDSTKAMYGMGWPWPSPVPHVRNKGYWYPARMPMDPEKAGTYGGPPDVLVISRRDTSAAVVDWGNFIPVHATQDYFYTTK